jgi:hypothetical protein
MRLKLAVVVLIFAAGCASTEMRTYVGKPIEEAMISYGPPENVFAMPDGRRAYQFRWGGGTYVTPGQATSRGTTIGNVTTVQTTMTPATIYESQGCLITFIAEDRDADGHFVVEEYRVPRQLVC